MRRMLTSFKCIMWIALAALAEVPIVVFLILDLNDAWNIMFGEVAIAVLSISAARMYRSLCQYGSFTEYVSTERPKVPPGTPMSYPENRITNVSGRIRFAAATQSNGTGTTSEAPVSMPADHVQSEFAPSVLNPKLVYEDTKEKVRYEMA
ncbi:hypothetical protein BJV78DRAFT_1365754 [Lactifluus subvellereus]|nr:hypothetical protein BJV78DRAFT_1365754 [Lactifluus subvellereus]